jgi:cell division protease FtsH
MKSYKPPKWLAWVGIGMLAVALWMWGPGSEPPASVSVANYAHSERIDFTDALKRVKTDPASIEKLVFVKGLRQFPDKVIVDTAGQKPDYVADIPGEFDYNVIASEADRQNVAKQSLPMSGKDARQEYTMGPADEGGHSPWARVMSTLFMVAMIVLPIVGIIWLMRMMQNFQGGGAAGAFAKSKHRKFEPDKGPKVTFQDVAGVDEVKEQAEMIVEFLKDPSELTDLGGKLPRGVLMVGKPGTGKTLLAKAIAGEAGVPVFIVNAPEFVEMFVGVGAARVRDLFEQIRQHAPCILFVDELDAVAQHRGTGIGGGNDERQQTLMQLMTEIDGFDTKEGFIAIAATNRPDVLDPAVLRGGRFGTRIIVPVPDRRARADIIKVHSRNVKLDPSIDPWELSGAMTGLVGADIHDVIKVHGPFYAVKRTRTIFGRGKKATLITREDLDKGISRIQMGGQSTEGASKRLSGSIKSLLAFHEASHALVGEYLHRMSQGWQQRWHDPVQKVTIIGAGGAGGYTSFHGDEEPFCQTIEQLLGMITSLLAATRGEQMFLGTRSTGAQNDIDRAYDIAKQMVTRFGFSSLGTISVGRTGDNPYLGMTMAQSGGYGLGSESSNQIDHEIFLILADCMLRAERILNPLRDLMHEVTPVLEEDETILRDKFAKIWDDHFAKQEGGMPVMSLAPLSETALLEALPGLGLRVPPRMLSRDA